MEMKVEIVARETIKPSSPTPHHLRTYKLSIRDQISPLLYMPVVFFYAPTTTLHSTSASGGDGDGDRRKRVDISQRLKESLSETLSHFYPLAGRLRDNLSVDCNDEGVDYFEARVINYRLSDFLERPDLEEMAHFAPSEPTDYYKTPLLLVQANFFPCNGLAVCVKISHKIADGVALAAFIKGWSGVALRSPDTVVPDFSAASSRFPPREDIPVNSLTFKDMSSKVTKRFVVDASKIAALKAKAASSSVQRPTRVEAVTALVWKCAVAASRSRLAVARKPYALTGAVNMRPRMVPPLPKHCFGNVSGMLWAMLDDDDDDYESQATNLPGLVYKLRKGIELCNDDDMAKKIRYVTELKGDDMEFYRQSSWCRFPLYEFDFGWGEPTWVAFAGVSGFPVGIALLDTRDGEGVEIWLTLIEEDMALFEADMEVLAYASSSPSPSAI